jgi:predicted Rossmann fold flavoprotein
MPQLGASSSGLFLAQESGHKITPLLPAMAPLFLAENWAKELSGISLPDAELSLSCGSTAQKSRGTLLFTHDGLSGMAALNLSNTAYRMWSSKPQKLKISLNFSAKKTQADYAQLLAQFAKEASDKLVKTSLSGLFPKALATKICEISGVENRKTGDLKASEKELLCRNLCAMPLSIEKLSPPEKAMAMSGGVSLKEINPATMGSRLVKGLFFAGEITDLTGPCGGFNITWALASGFLAAQG